uniref:Choline/carnitine acyltransferase domain-containing protein n=1 Tax=Haptolina ericina TaxID=156174 RepID=A0A7S3B0Y6_9EUKA|mmetsp:Transcript_4214/g.9140  ORF Transcript_4214/g.9140 Transcript_4214/m.9140 type:complete len:137 (+) Transcript_4214:38-448(+)|eukprot:CAMPEP_0181214976 /NCGR_PEP_ID=MMETSP1096-20121128/25759_1 /TAXON_ID=156174 ORGANISM="Chrysochromulina ericina, Strain CCMP281" /NCGR_SAMPLE_ID=MMETSP1096 /ASSEMBLY_ACC=CAM_ASM_000453 /LENGTH=136 /DNA_ID=CAMNT_0023306785 /DNA_START=34 /DNA_END=444 /DNA_ORIENTATION=-
MCFSTAFGDDMKVAAMRKAIGSLVEVVKKAAEGHGVDRHLYAIFQTWERSKPTGDAVPALFADAGWAALNHTTISTSNCGNAVLGLFGFGPVVADGFGIGYIIRDHSISFCAASKHRQTARYLHMIQEPSHPIHMI